MFSLDLWIKRYDITIVCKTKTKNREKQGWAVGIELGYAEQGNWEQSHCATILFVYVSGSEFR